MTDLFAPCAARSGPHDPCHVRQKPEGSTRHTCRHEGRHGDHECAKCGKPFHDIDVRPSDPKTSHDAAKHNRIRRSTQHGTILMALANHGPMNADELDKVIGWRVTTAGRRLKELSLRQLVEGKGAFHDTESGNMGQIWGLTGSGRAWVTNGEAV